MDRTRRRRMKRFPGNRILLLVLAVAPALCSCGNPGEYYTFSTYRYRDGNPIASFDYAFPITDTLSTYRIALSMRINAHVAVTDTVVAAFEYISPEDSVVTVTRDTMALTDAVRITRSGSMLDVELPVGEPQPFIGQGEWKVKVTLSDQSLLKSLRGVGFSYRKI